MFRYAIDSDDPTRLTPIVHALRSGSVVAMPTDTIYGFSARIDRPSALQRIAAAKGRDDATPFLVLVGSVGALATLTPTTLPPEVIELIWPGPVTALLEARTGLPPPLVGGRGTVAVRWPDSSLVREILAGVEHPVVSTSINRSGEEPLIDPAQIAQRFGDAIDVLVDAGPAPDPLPSTIVDMTRRPPIILRQGRAAVDIERLARCLDPGGGGPGSGTSSA